MIGLPGMIVEIRVSERKATRDLDLGFILVLREKQESESRSQEPEEKREAIFALFILASEF
jgi:hypothetical protein